MKPSGSIHAMLPFSRNTRFPISFFAAFLRRCGSWIRFSISRLMTSILLRKRRLSHKPKVTCRGRRRFSIRCIRLPTHFRVGNTSLPNDLGAPARTDDTAPKGTTGGRLIRHWVIINGELRFWLGWAQDLAGDHAAAQESWRQARSELEPFLKEQPENYTLIGDLALTNMGLGDKTAALALAERAIAAIPIEKDAMDGPIPIEILARVAAQTGESDRAIAALQKCSRYRTKAHWTLNIPLTPALLRLDPMFDPLRNDPRFQKLCEEKQH